MILLKHEDLNHQNNILDKDNSLLSVYVDCTVWAVSCMVGNDLGDFKPNTTPRVTMTLLLMLLGAAFHAQIFGDFQLILRYTRKAQIEQRKRFDKCKEFCIERKVEGSLRKKIKAFYSRDPKYFLESKLVKIDFSSQLYIFFNQLSTLQKKMTYPNRFSRKYLYFITRI